MMDPVAVGEVEKRARSALRQDGMAIIIAGVAFAILAPFFLDDRLGFLFILGTGLYVFLPEILRKTFVYPRIGFVKFKERKAKPWKLLISTVILVLFVIVLKLNAYNWLLPLYLGTVFGVIAYVIGYLYKTVVEYFLAGVILLSGMGGLVATMHGVDPGVVTAFQLWILAAVLVLVGSVQFTIFMHKNPLTKEHVDEAAG
ncbi:hypothetical protein AMJ52_07970 [candidate division TA06 bacterium DG_78]|uniref:Uncharacterized protein n=1 Tax=candidate division TA06 bacterium DG_78 TaxID=1703772 RepID=A0A0S7YBH8_UNCT6|nr:MAG: hypothetical protein AMJ52_07970 [candidate division TA06 bacterium DG_78]